MIQKKFIKYDRQADFEAALENGDISMKSIVFIKDKQTIWTHGTYFHGDLKDSDLESLRSSINDKVDANYVSTAISTELNKLEGTHREIVNSLPESGDSSIIYLVPADNGTDNSYDEFMWVKVGNDYRFEKIGSTSIDTSMASDQEVEDLLETIFS